MATKRKTVRALCSHCDKPFSARVDGALIAQCCSRSCGSKHRSQRPVSELVDMSAGPDECWPWLGFIENHGYGRVRRDGRFILAHRFVYEEMVGAIPDDLDLLHSCDSPPCCNPSHLFPGTHQDNMRDMVLKGRAQRLRGSEKPQAIIDEAIAAKIKERLMDSLATTVANELGVSLHIVYDIKSGKTWKHVKTEALA